MKRKFVPDNKFEIYDKNEQRNDDNYKTKTAFDITAISISLACRLNIYDHNYSGITSIEIQCQRISWVKGKLALVRTKRQINYAKYIEVDLGK